MTDPAGDVYRTPESDLTLPRDKTAKFYLVSEFKLMLLYFATLGFYGIYWFYRHWKQFKGATEQSLWPVPRAIFSIFFAHALFRRIDDAVDPGLDVEWRPQTLATLYVIFAIIGNLSDRLPQIGLDFEWVLVASLAALLMIAYVLYRAQAVANLACGDAHGRSNARITLTNVIWILLGLLFWLAVIAGFALEMGLIDALPD